MYKVRNKCRGGEGSDRPREWREERALCVVQSISMKGREITNDIQRVRSKVHPFVKSTASICSCVATVLDNMAASFRVTWPHACVVPWHDKLSSACHRWWSCSRSLSLSWCNTSAYTLSHTHMFESSRRNKTITETSCARWHCCLGFPSWPFTSCRSASPVGFCSWRHDRLTSVLWPPNRYTVWPAQRPPRQPLQSATISPPSSHPAIIGGDTAFSMAARVKLSARYPLYYVRCTDLTLPHLSSPSSQVRLYPTVVICDNSSFPHPSPSIPPRPLSLIS